MFPGGNFIGMPRFDAATARSLAGSRQRIPVGPVTQQGLEKLERQTLIAQSRSGLEQTHDQNTGGNKAGEDLPADLQDDPDEPDLAFDPIAAALRQIHDHVAAEEIPEEFLRLLDQLDEIQTREPGK